ncbi:hypothetical protein [Enterococcus crotali]|uniref:hypothetical protein n=1 Tax=Enterococcus crotali TaxID=1453587 RepID=UPI0004724D55|nr:hypothetical protein [Enterococcus crotali]
MKNIKCLEFQENTIDTIKKSFQDENMLILRDHSGIGKSVLGQKIHLTNYKKFFIKGNYIKMHEEFGAFLDDFNIEGQILKNFVKDSTNSALNTAASFFIPSSNIDFSNTVDALFNKATKSDMNKILELILSEAQKYHLFFVFDELLYYDLSSLLLFKYIIDYSNQTNSSVKVLIIANDDLSVSPSFQKQIIPWKTTKILTMQDFTEKDRNELGTNEKVREVRLSNQSGALKAIKIQSLKETLHETIAGNITKKIILQTLKLFDESINLMQLDASIPEYTFDEIEFHLKRLEKLDLIQTTTDSQDNLIVTLLEEVSAELEQVTPSYIKKNRSDIYLNYLEIHTPQNYLEKFHYNQLLGNMDDVQINGVLAYCYVQRENIVLNSKYSEELLNFINNEDSSDYLPIIKKTYSYYTNERYFDCFEVLDSFLKVHPNHFDYSEIWAELIYLRSLSLGRLKDRGKYLKESDLIEIEKYIDAILELGNLELAMRLKEAKFFLWDCWGLKENTDTAAKTYFSILDFYSKQIRIGSKKNRFFWQLRQAIFGSKIDMIDIPEDKMPLFEKSYKTLLLHRENVPNQYLRAACNFSGRNLWEKNYSVCEEVLQKAIEFITDKRISSHWGIIKHNKLVVDYVQNKEIKPILEGNSYLINTEEIFEKMHEPNIHLSNHAVFLANSDQIDEALFLIDEQLTTVGINNYNKYLLTTNKRVLAYSYDDTTKVEESSKQIEALINAGIPNFDQVFVQKREEAINEIIKSERKITDFRKSMRDPASAGSMKNNSDIYFRPLLVSNITYWVN